MGRVRDARRCQPMTRGTTLRSPSLRRRVDEAMALLVAALYRDIAELEPNEKDQVRTRDFG